MALPRRMTVLAMQGLFANIVASVSFRDAPPGTIAMVDTWTADEAQRATTAVRTSKIAGALLQVVSADTAEGDHLRRLFQTSERNTGHTETAVMAPPLRVSFSVLVLDDDDESLHIITTLLAYGLPGLSIGGARTPQEAGDWTDQKDCCVILADVEMCKRGLALMRQLRHIQPDTAMILMTDNPRRLEDILGSGAFAILRKPVNPENCVRVIGQAVTSYWLKAGWRLQSKPMNTNQ